MQSLFSSRVSRTWMVWLPLCFTSSLVMHTCHDIPVLTTAKRDTYIRGLLFLVPAWMTAGFPQISITPPEVAIWWSSCQVYSYPHSSNNPFFKSVLVFLALTLFRKADVGVPSQWSIVMVLPLRSAFSLPFSTIWWHIVQNHGSQENIWSILYNNPLAVCLYGCFSTLWGLDSLQRFLLRQIISW